METSEGLGYVQIARQYWGRKKHLEDSSRWREALGRALEPHMGMEIGAEQSFTSSLRGIDHPVDIQFK